MDENKDFTSLREIIIYLWEPHSNKVYPFIENAINIGICEPRRHINITPDVPEELWGADVPIPGEIEYTEEEYWEAFNNTKTYNFPALQLDNKGQGLYNTERIKTGWIRWVIKRAAERTGNLTVLRRSNLRIENSENCNCSHSIVCFNERGYFSPLGIKPGSIKLVCETCNTLDTLLIELARNIKKEFQEYLNYELDVEVNHSTRLN